MENENKSFVNILISFLRSCSQNFLLIFQSYSRDHVHNCERDLRQEMGILAKLLFTFSTIVFNMMKQALTLLSAISSEVTEGQ